MATKTKKKKPTLDDLKAQGLDLIEWYTRIEESKTIVLAKLAEVVVDIRQKFIDPETGNPDWRGKSYDYRVFMNGFYEAAGLPPDSQATIQASLRYHVGNRVRAVAPPEQLEAAGLKTTTPRERTAAARSEAAAIKHAFGEGKWAGWTGTATGKVTTPADLVQRWTTYSDAVAKVIQRMEAIEVDALPPASARQLHQAVEDTIVHLEKVAKALRERSKITE